jgi:(4S)-4-hydroxy-5-phosphonooxypentane-2,3-dione isomerase
MLVVHIQIHIKPEFIQAFKIATIDNARNSLQEPGITRFDFAQQIDDPTRFSLVEIYQSEEATVKHKETAHYARWRDTVEEMMAEPRTRIVFTPIYPVAAE